MRLFLFPDDDEPDYLTWFLVAVLAAVALAILSTIAFGQTVHAKLADGSQVQLKLQQESIEVGTKYGKLTIPCADIRKVEFGVHYPAGRREQIQAEVGLLGSPMQKEREAAQKRLLAFGREAYPLIVLAAKDKDPEVALRAAAVREKMEESLSGLKTRWEDLVYTPDLKITGRIVSAGIKVRSEPFGDATLGLYQFVALHQLGSEMAYALQADQPGKWQDTGIDVNMVTSIQASGQIDMWPSTPGQYMVRPNGYTQTGHGWPFAAGAIVGKVDSGATFLVGERFLGKLPEGRLFLTVVPAPWPDQGQGCRGTYSVKVHFNPE